MQHSGLWFLIYDDTDNIKTNLLRWKVNFFFTHFKAKIMKQFQQKQNESHEGRQNMFRLKPNLQPLLY